MGMKELKRKWKLLQGLGFRGGNEGMKKKRETTIMDYIRATIGIHAFILGTAPLVTVG